MKLGVLGGTFNPIHLGHLVLAEQAREKLSLDKIIFMPANLSPHKENSDVAPAFARYQMVKIAIQGNKYFSVSRLEIKRGGTSYSVDTLKQLRRIYPKDELFFIVGSDVLKDLADWKDIEEIFSLAKFVVATRPGYPIGNMPPGIIALNIRAVDICAYEIREFIKNGFSVRYLVPDKVILYIKKKGLYR